jgi:cytochrome c-type biogenesis protein CcmH
MNVRRCIAVFALMATLMGGWGVALAQEGSGLSPEELDNLTAQVAAELRCLVCRGQSVLESNSQLAQEMKALIHDRLASGETPDEVKAYFVRSYGEYILLKPTARGVSLLVYVLPALALVGGGLLLLRLFRRWTRPAAAAAGSGSAAPAARESAGAPAGEPPEGDTSSSASELSPEEAAWLREQLQGK